MLVEYVFRLSQDEHSITLAKIRQRAYELWERNYRPDGF
nr:DUF2934 domain-containing protein [Methylobacterium sp. L1A1]